MQKWLLEKSSFGESSQVSILASIFFHGKLPHHIHPNACIHPSSKPINLASFFHTNLHACDIAPTPIHILIQASILHAYYIQISGFLYSCIAVASILFCASSYAHVYSINMHNFHSSMQGSIFFMQHSWHWRQWVARMIYIQSQLSFISIHSCSIVSIHIDYIWTEATATMEQRVWPHPHGLPFIHTPQASQILLYSSPAYIHQWPPTLFHTHIQTFNCLSLHPLNLHIHGTSFMLPSDLSFMDALMPYSFFIMVICYSIWLVFSQTCWSVVHGPKTNV